MRRFTTGSRAPLAVAGIMATPLFFVGLMAMSLALEKPSVTHVLRHGKTVVRYGDPTGENETAIWLLAGAVALFMFAVGTGAMLLGRRGVLVSAAAAVVAALALMLPLGSWARTHTSRYPNGVDLIPKSAGSSDVYLPGEWEGSAKHTARDLAFVAIAMAGITVAGFGLLGMRRRRAVLVGPPLEGIHAPDATPPGLSTL